MQAGFWPDRVSTDASTTSRDAARVIDFPNVMSKLLNFGMTIDEVVACATVNASRVYPFWRDRGTLNVGAQADIAVLELREGSFEFVDNYENLRTGSQRLFPHETVLRRPACATGIDDQPGAGSRTSSASSPPRKEALVHESEFARPDPDQRRFTDRCRTTLACPGRSSDSGGCTRGVPRPLALLECGLEGHPR